MTTPAAPLRRLGLTGSIGAGKSTVAALLRARGLTVLDADEQARHVTQEPETLRAIGNEFPGTVTGGVLDRAALAAAAFRDPQRTAALNAIVHPRVRARMAALEAQAAARGEPWVVQDVPLLFEGGLDEQMDAVLVVDAPLEERVARVMARSGLSREDVLARDARQLGAAEKRQRATVVIENAGPPDELGARVDAALHVLGIHPRSRQV
ncbi:dephospho-CoA kinase [Deinococcus metalli]|uniref:Dephospho-CoA kinase n=1 Tax=Deinococcus metalli TaxID=1141878 RepID=A0A7W8NQJ4_9DEIO|nr:dephospho-CoA kinase [Deinococcus metalli]MBB5376850.1 dephospho-CoA kinase [Deinococcus metalli]GHF45830.1 dephospho-CoA kinase [Deinococcus metalli]